MGRQGMSFCKYYMYEHNVPTNLCDYVNSIKKGFRVSRVLGPLSDIKHWLQSNLCV